MPNNDNNSIANLFAFLDDEQTPIRRIPMTNQFQQELGVFFSEQLQGFIADKQHIAFTGSYNVDSGEIFQIEDYPLPDAIANALSNPLNNPILNLSTETHRIKALFTGKWSDQEQQVSFQVFDAGKLLSKGWTLIGSNDTYKKLEEPGLILQDKLTAHFSGGNLFFVSYHNTKRFLDLSDYYTAATDTDLDTFAENELFEFEDQETFKGNADSIIRKKIALLQKNNVLDNLSINDIETVANDFNQHVADEHQIVITTNNGKLVIPKDKKQLKELVRFLDEDYVTAPLTKRRCLTNSKQYL
jgi:hypothetical protein